MKKGKKLRNLLIVFVCLSVFCGALVNAGVIVPTIVSETNTNHYSSASMTKTINNAGMLTPVNAGDSLATAMAALHAFPGGATDSWVTNAAAPDYFAARPNPEVAWDLTGGGDTAVGTAIFWQYQNGGGNEDGRTGNHVKTIELQFNTEAQGSTNFAGPVTTLTLAPLLHLDDDNVAQVFGLSGDDYRYVKMVVTDNHFGSPGIIAGGDRVGIGEIRFATEKYLAPEDVSKALNPEVTQTDSASPADVDVTLSWDTGLAYDPADANEIIADPAIIKHAIYMSDGSLTDPNLYFVDEIDASGTGASYGPVALPRSRTFYWRIDELTDANTIAGDVWSFVTMTADPTIVSGPADQYINIGDTAMFGVEAVNPFTDDSSGLGYEWHRVDDAGDTIVGGDSPTYTTPEQTTDNSDDGYYCVVSIVVPDVDASAVTDMVYVVIKQRIAYWPFDETYENIDDVSGLTDGVPAGDPNFAEGLVNAGQALTLDGTDGYVAVDNDALDWSATGSFSISLWTNVNVGSGGHRAAISNRHDPAADGYPKHGFILYAQPGDTWGFWTGVQGSWAGPGGVPFDGGEWIHLVISFEPTGSSGINLVGTSTLYVNGVQSRQVVGDLYKPQLPGQSPLFIGAGQNEDPANFFFNGLIDDVRAYNYAITHEKVATLYTDVVGPACIFGNPTADVTGPEGIPDCAVDFFDFAEFALQWLEHGYFPYRPGVID